jgi:transposase
MQRDELERLSKDELIELVLRLQRPAKTSRTSSKPPSTDRKERREQARPGGAKPGHEGHSRTLSTDPDCGIGHAPQQCPCCRLALSSDLPSEAVLSAFAPDATTRCGRRSPPMRPAGW